MKSKSTTQLKRTLCMVMAVLLTFGVFFNAAFVVNAAEERNDSFGGAPVASGDNWKYYSDGELVITGNIADYPDDDGNYAPWYQYRANIKTITIQEGVTSIGAYAFYEFTGTSKIYIPGSVTSISADAFKGFSLTYAAFGGSEEDFNKFPPLGVNVQINHVHTDGAIKHKKAADCKNDGYTGDIYCVACGAFFKAGSVIDSTTVPHTWSTTMKTKTPATCKKAGQKGYYCTKCGAFDESSLVPIPKTDHKWVFDGTKIETCDSANSQIGIKCETCGTKSVDNLKNPTKGDWLEGKKHKYLYKVYDPTCTEKGYTHVSCKYCNAVNYDTDWKDALGHKPDKLDPVQPRTCTEEGIYKHVCSRPGCNYVDSITKLPPLGHNFTIEYIAEGDEPHCPVFDKNTNKYTDDGYGWISKKCSNPNCDELEKDENGNVIKTKIENLHSRDSEKWSVTQQIGVEADCMNDGQIWFKCNYCNELIYKEDSVADLENEYVDDNGNPNRQLENEIIPKTPDSHNASTWIRIEDPTCENDGLEIKKCTTDGCSYKGDFSSENSSNKNTYAQAISEAIDYASDDTVVKAITKAVDDALADQIAAYILNQYYGLKDPVGYDEANPNSPSIAKIINDYMFVPADNPKLNLSAEEKEEAVKIINNAAEAIKDAAVADLTLNITRQLVADYIAAAFESMGAERVKAKVDAARNATGDDKKLGEEAIKLIKLVPLDTRTVPALGHKYQVVSYYREVIEDGTDEYYPVGEYDGKYYNIVGYEKDENDNYTAILEIYKLDDAGKIIYVKDENNNPTAEIELIENYEEKAITGKTIVSDVDCNIGGTLVKQCPVCGSKNATKVEKGSHSYINTIIEPTCTEQGYRLQTCEFCTYRKTSDYTPSTGHNWQLTIIKESSCTKTGLQAMKCTNCHDTDKKTFQPVNTVPHDYTITVVDPTCTEDGYTQYTCKVCGGGYKDQFVDALNHKFVDTVTKVTCTTDGYTTHTCSVCGYEYKDDKVFHSGHQWGEAQDIIPVACTEESYTLKICTVCGAEDKSDFGVVKKAENHVATEDVAVKPSCTIDGKTQGWHCDVCGEVIVAQEDIPASGHKVVDIAAQPATCTKAGHTAGSYCSVCGEILKGTDNIPKKAHTPNISKATCTEDKVCTVCGKVLEKATDHSYGDWVVTKEYTAFRNGEKAHTCTKCGHVETAKVVPNIFQRIAWIFTHFLDIILALLGKANGVFK